MASKDYERLHTDKKTLETTSVSQGSFHLSEVGLVEYNSEGTISNPIEHIYLNKGCGGK